MREDMTERPFPSIRRLRAICQAEKLRRPRDLTRRHRAVSIYATWLLARTPVTADQVTLASIAFGLAAAAFLGAQGLAAGLLGVLLLYASFLLDQVDGEIARFRRRPTLRGVYLDELRHLVIYAAPVFALGYEVSRATEASWPVVAGFVASLVLAVARVEERLPALIFGERAISLVADAAQPTIVFPANQTSEAPGALANAARLVGDLASRAYGLLAHQVLLIAWILVAVLVDRGIDRPVEGGLEGLLLLALAVASSLTLAGQVASRSHGSAVSEDIQARASAARACAIRSLPGPARRRAA
jgi:phosphatidylglycerophosphate synthase